MLRLFITIICIHALSGIQAQDDIFGRWKSIDDETGEEKSIVEIYKQDGRAYGRIVDLLNPPADDPDPLCDQCKDHRKNKRIRGMEIISGLERDGKVWASGEILDPENGKIYRCKIWVEDGLLKVRGYVSFLFRTQTWLPAKG